MKLNIDLGSDSDNGSNIDLKEGFRKCKVAKADYNEEWDSIKLDLKCEGNLSLYPMIFPPEWKQAALFRTAGCTSADTDELVGKEIPVLVYKETSGYLRGFDIFSNNEDYVMSMFKKSVNGGYIVLHSGSKFAEEPEVIEEDNSINNNAPEKEVNEDEPPF